MNMCKPENWTRNRTSSTEKRNSPGEAVTESTQLFTANIFV